MIDEAIRERDELIALDRARRRRRGGDRASCRARSASSRTRRSSAIEARVLRRSADLPHREWPAVIAALRAGLEERQGACGALRRAAAARRARAHRAPISSIFCTASCEPRKNIVTQGHPRTTSRRCASACSPSRSASARCSRARRAVETRDRTAALVTIAHEVIARYRAEKDRRGLLDYDDLIDKTLRLLSDGSRRLGALQARSRHRPRADRRGAGHEPEAVGDRQALTAEFFAGAGARDGRRARSSRSATRSSRSSRSRARRRASSTQMRRHFAGALETARACASRDVKFKYSFRSAPDVLDAVDTVFRRRAAYRRPDRGPGRDRARGGARQRARPGRALADDRAGREARARRLGRAVRRDPGDKPAREARAAHRQHRQDVDRPARAGRRRRSGTRSRRATSWCWCASAARCSRRSSAR